MEFFLGAGLFLEEEVFLGADFFLGSTDLLLESNDFFAESTDFYFFYFFRLLFGEFNGFFIGVEGFTKDPEELDLQDKS